jgi:pimeloyl-ACP methyl ester carboxylesterase
MKKSIQFLSLVSFTIIFLLTQCAIKHENGYAEINGTKLFYEITGEGTPLVFLHGWTCDHRNWNSQVEYFSKKYKVITYDARGHGKSNVPDSIPYSYVDDLASLLDYLKIEKAVLIGHSLGGAPVFYYSLNHPERVQGLVLAEGGAVLSDPAIVDTSSIPGYFNEFSQAISIAQNEGLEKGKKAWLKIHPMKNAAENPISAELLKTMIDDYSGWHWLNTDPQKRNPNGTIEMMGSIKAPTLIIAGEYSHKVLKDLVSAQSLYIPNSKLVILEKSNHMLNIENPKQFNTELELFLKENKIE